MMLRKGTPLQPKSRKVNKYEEHVVKLYHLEDKDYRKWTRLAGRVRSLVRTIKQLPEESVKRQKCTNILIDELFGYGVIPSKLMSLDDLEGFATSAFARRQLWWIVTKKKMAPDYYAAKEIIEKVLKNRGLIVTTYNHIYQTTADYMPLAYYID
uniref:Uncharacterized protein n=1 Tax=Lotharella oceanica TaxID=641309 RepID=A0A7S2XEH3_9EUKA|mmetsp:Transcript_35418/g.65603  ORF Transcript_35418/g.65603 Transcript_35418/m.65603 type:complete len:154 (+) Transcript_35418:3-464(+)